jgi:hypothetical protein
MEPDIADCTDACSPIETSTARKHLSAEPPPKIHRFQPLEPGGTIGIRILKSEHGKKLGSCATLTSTPSLYSSKDDITAGVKRKRPLGDDPETKRSRSCNE